MKIKALILTFIITVTITSCKVTSVNDSYPIRKYVADDKELYDQIVTMDKEFWDAYNNWDLQKQACIYSDDIKFYHDKGGVMTSKQDIITATEKYISGKVTRKLVKGSIEVYPIKNYGAVEIGFHKFHNNQEPNTPSHPSKFIIIWHNINMEWKIAEVISLH
jgi:hypothetical protein